MCRGPLHGLWHPFPWEGSACAHTPLLKEIHLTVSPSGPFSYQIGPVAPLFQRPVHHLALNLPKGFSTLQSSPIPCCHPLHPQVCHVEPGV